MFERGAAVSEASDREDFIRQLSASHNSLLGFILSLLPDLHAASDVLQETHVEMWRKADDFEPGTNFLAWACRIAHFKVLEARAKQRRSRLVFDDELIGQIAVEAEAHERATGDAGGALEDCLARLSVKQRELVRSRYAEGGSVKKLAEKMGRSTQGLAVTLFRIRQTLLECIQKKERGVRSG
jgi:RNA polymerase sigma-70 factor (ECF subfamily)